MKNLKRSKRTRSIVLAQNLKRGHRAVVEAMEPRVLMSAGYVYSERATFPLSGDISPTGGVIADSAGNLFGTTSAGGQSGRGTIFEIAAGSGTMTQLASFSNITGFNVSGSLTLDSGGNLYGVTRNGGGGTTGVLGTLFKCDATTHAISVLKQFSNATGKNPVGGVKLVDDRYLFGSTPLGSGTVFVYDLLNSTFATYASSLSVNSNLAFDLNDRIFWTTSSGQIDSDGNSNGGIFYTSKFDNSTTIDHVFNTLAEGFSAGSQIVTDGTGVMYGVLKLGGLNSAGGIYEYFPGGTFNMRVSFENGSSPAGDLAIDSYGNLFTTLNGNGGSVVEVPWGSSTLQTVATFGVPSGRTPVGSMFMDSRGSLFGVTAGSTGLSINGTVFQLAGYSQWNGASQTSDWNNDGNWVGGDRPLVGEDVTFTDLGQNSPTTINLNGQVKLVNDLQLYGSYSLQSGSISPAGNINVVASASEIENLMLNHDSAINVGTGGRLTIDLLGGGYDLWTVGSGVVEIADTDSSFTGTFLAQFGALEINTTIATAVNVDTGGTLQGSGSVAGFSNAGNVYLGANGNPATLTSTDSVSFASGSTLTAVLGQTNGVEIDGKLVVTGSNSTITLTNTALDVQRLSNFIPPVGHVITVISNQTGTAANGTFNGLAEGAITTINGVAYRISYQGGNSEQDVTLTVLAATWTGAGNDGLWSTAANWQAGVAPSVGQNVSLPIVGNNASVEISLSADVTVGNLVFDGSRYTLVNHTLTVNGDISVQGFSNYIGSELNLTHTTLVDIDSDCDLNLNIVGGGFDLNKDGAGLLTVGGESSTAGNLHVLTGRLQIDGSFNGSVTLDPGTTLFGQGGSNGLTASGGTLSLHDAIGTPSAVFQSGTISFSNGAVFHEWIGDDNGTEADGQLFLTGVSTNLDLTGASLAVSRRDGYAPALGHVITLISNQTGHAVTGTFVGLPEGALATINGASYRVNYAVGVNNNVTLTLVATPIASQMVFSQQPLSAMSGQSIGTVVVNLTDTNGDLVTDAATLVTLTTADGAPLTGTTSVRAVHGVATFSGISIKLGGLHRLVASIDGLSVQSNLINISPLRNVLANFGDEGINPSGGIVEDSKGNLYGTTLGDPSQTIGLSANAYGTVFKFDVLTQTLSTIATFDDLTNGSFPLGSLLIDSDDNLYGTTSEGGVLGHGTIFKLARTGSAYAPLTTLANFTSNAIPQGGLVIDSQGNLFGAAYTGGQYGYGYVFRLAGGSSDIVTIASFNGTTDGAGPSSGLTIDPAGNLFGTTRFGGQNGVGTIFEIAANSSSITTLAGFDSSSGGLVIQSELAIDVNGNLFGATPGLGLNGAGAIFELAAGSSTITTLYSFDDDISAGGEPMCGVVMGPDGYLYGATSVGNGYSKGSVYKYDVENHAFTILLPLTEATGFNTIGRVFVNSRGQVFGTAEYGGAHSNTPTGDGTLFAVVTVPTATQVVVVAQPTTIGVGAPQTFTINFSDANGFMTDYSGPVTIGAPTKPNGSHLGGGNTATAENGVATFTGVTVDVAGTYVIEFDAGILTAATSTDITAVFPTWTGAGSDDLWSNPANWQGGVVGGNGSAVSFPDLGSTVTNIVLDSAVDTATLTFDGLYSITGAALRINAGITANATSEIESVVLLYDCPVTVAASTSLTIQNIDDLGTNCVMFKGGDGTLIFGQTSAYYLMFVQGGVMEVNALGTAPMLVESAGTLSGSGTVTSIGSTGGVISLSSGGSPTVLTSSGSVTLDSASTLVEYISSTSGIENDGQLVAQNGTVDVTGATLTITLLGGFTPPAGRVITLISNQTGNSITGTFAGLAEGAELTVGGATLRISYVGGNALGDVTLTVVAPPAISSADNTSIAVGQPDAFTVSTTGGPTPSISVLGTLPPGMTFHDNGNNTATFSGTPTADGIYPVTITAANGVGSDATQTFTFTVNAPLTVTNMTDTHVTGELSLREALALATNGSYVIDLPSGTFLLTQGVLTSAGAGHKLTVRHTGNGTTTINGQGQSTVFRTLVGTTTILSGLILTEGQANQGAALASGGGIQNAGVLTLNNTIVTGNAAGMAGGAIANTMGTLTLNNSILSDNTATNFGGGGIANNHGTVTINNSSIIRNSTPQSGGGIYMYGGTLQVVSSTFSDNSALGNGGGIYNVDSAISTVTNSTFGDNVGGGIDNVVGTVVLHGSIVTGSSGGNDLSGVITGTRDLIGDGSMSSLTTALVGSANLSPLGNYGGFTPTRPVLPGSLALGNNGVFNVAMGLDQRGVTRSLTAPTIGAFETDGFALTITSTAPPALTAGQAYTYAVTSSGFPTGTMNVTGTLPAGVTYTDNGDGTATLAGTPTVAGQYPLTLTATNGGGSDGTQSVTLVVSAGAPSQLTFVTPPAVAHPGADLGTLVVRVVDANNNVIVADTSTVTLATNPINALAGTTSVQAVQGVATFTGLSIAALGRYTLTASNGQLSSDTNAVVFISNADAVWTRGANNNNWSSPANWAAGSVPTSGQSLEFPSIGANPNIDVDVDVVVNNLTFNDLYYLSGSHTLTLNGDVTFNSAGGYLNAPVVLTHHTNVTVNNGVAERFDHLNTVGGNLYTLTKLGAGSLDVAGTFAGDVEVVAGTLNVNSTIASHVTVGVGGTLVSNGQMAGLTSLGTVTIGTITQSYTATVTGDVTLGGGSTLQQVVAYDSDSGTHSVGTLVAAGQTVDLTGSTFDVVLPVNVTPTLGEVFTTIMNQTGSAIVGTFAGLPEGAVKTINGVGYKVSYVGGLSGSDLTLTVAPPSAVWTGAGTENLWSDAANWQGNVAPASGDDITIDLENASTNIINVDVSVTVGNLTLNNVWLTGEPITLGGDLFIAGTALILNPITLTHDTAVQTQSGIALLSGSINDGGHGYGLTVANHSFLLMFPLSVDNDGNPVLGGPAINNTYTGDTVVSESYFLFTGSMTSVLRVDNSSLVSTGGSVASLIDAGISGTNHLSLTNFGLISEAVAATVTIQNDLQLSAGTTVMYSLGGTAAADGVALAGSSQIHVLAGTVDLGSATLNVSFANGYLPQNNDVITLVRNDTGHAVTGTFAGLAEGATVTIDTSTFTISYAGGASGHDVTLTAHVADLNATQLTITQQPQTSTAAGQSVGTVVVRVLNAEGNLVTTDTSSVTLTSSTALGGSVTVQAAGGIAIFTDVFITQAGAYSLTATDGSLTPATSNVFTITPAAATHLVVVTQPTSAVAGATVGVVAVQIQDAFGNIVTTDTSEVVLSTSTSITGTTNATASQGVATFTGLSINLAGEYTLSVTGGTLMPATTNAITVSPAAASRLVITQQPTSAAAGATLGTVVVHIEDAYANLVTTDTSVVTLSADGVLVNGTLTAPASAGVATFTGLSINLAGTYTLSAQDGSLAGSTSDSFAITPAAASRLVIVQQPAMNRNGRNLAIEVQVEDVFGNVVTNETSTVTLNSVEGAPLAGTTSAAVINGVAIFDGVSINRLGTHTLSLSDGDLFAATTSPVTVIAILSSMVVTSPAMNVDQGASVQLSVTGADQFGDSLALADVVWTLDAGSTGNVDSSGVFTAGTTAGPATVRTSSEGQSAAVTISVNNPRPTITVAAFAEKIAVNSPSATLHVQGNQTGNNENLIYTWEIISQPGLESSPFELNAEPGVPAPLAIFSVNGTHAASDTSVTFLASGDYTFRVTVSDGTTSASSDVSVTAAVTAPVGETTLVSGVRNLSDGRTITGFVLTFNAPLDPTTAQDVAGYAVLQEYKVTKKASFWSKLFGGRNHSHMETSAYPLASAVYDASGHTVTINLASPMPVQNGVRIVQVRGSGAAAVRNAAGEIINGDSNESAGGDFSYKFTMQVAPTVHYKTPAGDAVTLSLSGPGRIASLFGASSDRPTVFLRDTDRNTSILTGSVVLSATGLGYVILDQLNNASKATIRLGDEFYINARIE